MVEMYIHVYTFLHEIGERQLGDRIRFDWREWVVDKLAHQHCVETHEAEECFFNKPVKQRRTMENKMLLYGRTDAGRYLFVVFVRQGSVVRVISAREMTSTERKYFRKK
jgi:uncharacterized DUF497 family protein